MTTEKRPRVVHFFSGRRVLKDLQVELASVLDDTDFGNEVSYEIIGRMAARLKVKPKDIPL